MRMETKAHGDVTIVALAGELDAVDGPRFAQLLEEARGSGKLVLNVRRLRFIDASNLGLLAGAARALQGNGGRFVLSEPSGLLRAAIEAVGLDRVMPMFARDDVVV